MSSSFRKTPGMETAIARSADVEAELRKRAEAAAAASRSIAPVESGDYLEGIKVASGIGALGAEAEVAGTDFKSGWIEFGTVFQSAKAILRRGAEMAGLKLVAGGDDE